MYYNDKKRIKIVQVVNIGIDIDEGLSETSENPVQNKVITEEFNKFNNNKQDVLTAGGGIGINKNVISSLVKGVLCRKLAVEQSLGSSYVNLIFGENLFTYGKVSYNSSNEIVIGEDVSAIKITLTSAYYNMSAEGYSTVRIYKNGTNIGQELWYSYQSGISGGGACSIIIPCVAGDKFKLGMRVVSGHSGYINNNTFIVAEVI